MKLELQCASSIKISEFQHNQHIWALLLRELLHKIARVLFYFWFFRCKCNFKASKFHIGSETNWNMERDLSMISQSKRFLEMCIYIPTYVCSFRAGSWIYAGSFERHENGKLSLWI